VARPKQSSRAELTPGQASYVLDRLLRDRRVSAGDVSRYVNDMRREIADLQQRLESLRAASGAGEGGVTTRRAGRPAATPSRRGRRPGRRTAVTAERRASQQLQGRYLGLIRQIPKTRRTQYQKLAKEKGREAAIKEMASALGK
jgi:hypothetical protein